MQESKIDQLIALTQHLEAINEAVRCSADKLIELGVIGDFNVMSGTLGKCQASIDNISEVKALVNEAIELNQNSNYTPKF